MVLDIKISRENNNFATSVYWNPTFSGVFTNFESFFFKSYELVYFILYYIEDLVHAPIWESSSQN